MLVILGEFSKKTNEKIEMDQQTLERISNAVDNFGRVIRDYREKKALMLDSLASRVG